MSLFNKIQTRGEDEHNFSKLVARIDKPIETGWKFDF